MLGRILCNAEAACAEWELGCIQAWWWSCFARPINSHNQQMIEQIRTFTSGQHVDCGGLHGVSNSGTNKMERYAGNLLKCP